MFCSRDHPLERAGQAEYVLSRGSIRVVRLNGTAESRSEGPGRSYECGTNIVVCDSQVRAGALALLYISL